MFVVSDQFGGSDADMFRGDDLTFLCGGSDEGSPGQVIGAAINPSGALMDRQDGLFGEEV